MGTLKIFNNHLKVSFVLLGLTEACAFFGSVYLATAVRFNTFEFGSLGRSGMVEDLPLKAGVFAMAHLLGMIALGQYQREQYRGLNGFLQMVIKIVAGMVLAFLGLIILYFILPQTELGRGIAALAFLISLASVLTLRQLFFHFVDGNIFSSKVLVFGTGERAASLLAHSRRSQLDRQSYIIQGFVATPSQRRSVPDFMIIELGDSLLAQARALDVNEIVLALDDRRKDHPTQHLLACKMAGISVIDPVTFLEREQGKVNLKLMNPSWMIYSEGFTASRLKAFVSRLFDIAASLTILTLTSPILLVTAFLISVEGGFREPVFYRQVRVGKDGKHFDLLKFRSMQVNAEKNGAQWAGQNDARVTKVGRIIRKFRIDELPQIINILKGDMRLVGPRPERPEFVSKLNETISMYNQRHAVKPGLAGWAQLKYPYGASEEDAYEKLQYDLFYIKNGNLVMDFFILIQTLEVVIFGKGVR